MIGKKGNGLSLAVIATAVTVLLIIVLDNYAPQFGELIGFSETLVVLIRTLIIFTFAFIMLRLLGKRQLSQLTFVDLLIIIALGSAVGDVMIYTENVVKLINSIIAVGFTAMMVMVLNKIILKHPNIGRLIEGRSTILIKKGKILHDALAKESMNEEELWSELRGRGIRRLSDLDKVVLEPTGKLSIWRKRHSVNVNSKINLNNHSKKNNSNNKLYKNNKVKNIKKFH